MIAQRDNDAHGGAWDDEITGALRYTPLHHLNTTTRKARSAKTFGCKSHTDKDAGAHPLVGADTGTRALGLWVPRGKFLKDSYFVIAGARVKVTARPVALAWLTAEEHSTEAGDEQVFEHTLQHY